MNELNASFANVLAGLQGLAQTISTIDQGLRSAFRLDTVPVPSQPAEAPALALPVVEDDQHATPPVHVEATPSAPTTTSPTGAGGKAANFADLPPVEVPAPIGVEGTMPAEGHGVAQDATSPETTDGPTTMPTTTPATEETAGQEEESTAPTVPVPVLAGTSSNGTGRPSGRGGRRGK